MAGVDVTQSIGDRMRMTAGTEKDKCRTFDPTMMPAQEVWLSKVSGKPFHRLLLGAEALQLQGWPVLHPRWCGLLEKNSDRQLRDLAGNAFPATIIQCLITAVTFAATAHKQFDDHKHTCDGDVAAVLALSCRG